MKVRSIVKSIVGGAVLGNSLVCGYRLAKVLGGTKVGSALIGLGAGFVIANPLLKLIDAAADVIEDEFAKAQNDISEEKPEVAEEKQEAPKPKKAAIVTVKGTDYIENEDGSLVPVLYKEG